MNNTIIPKKPISKQIHCQINFIKRIAVNYSSKIDVKKDIFI